MTGHRYVSTACQHGLHGECRRMCKFCAATCECLCEHIEPDEHPHEPWPADAPTETGDLIAALRASVEAARERRKAEADGDVTP